MLLFYAGKMQLCVWQIHENGRNVHHELIQSNLFHSVEISQKILKIELCVLGFSG